MSDGSVHEIDADPFTEEDEKELLKGDIDQSVLTTFRLSYIDNNESCPILFQAAVVNVSVEEIERRGVTVATNRDGNVFDFNSIELKIPAGFRDGTEYDSNNAFTTLVCLKIVEKQWEELKEILQESPHFKCAVCANSPVTHHVSTCCQKVLSPIDGGIWSINLVPYFPVCANDKCHLIAVRCVEKMIAKGTNPCSRPCDDCG
jgi:hypothetical protein